MSAPNMLDARWRKSSRSSGNTNCVEVAHVPGVAAVRDSKNPSGPALLFGPAMLEGFLSGVRVDRFHH